MILLTGCFDLNPRVPPTDGCVDVCQASAPVVVSEPMGPGQPEAALAMQIVAPSGAQQCDRFRIEVTKRVRTGDAVYFKPGVFRVRVGGCQSGTDIAEYAVEAPNTVTSISFVLDVDALTLEGPQRLCVARFEPGAVCPTASAWVSDTVDVTRACEAALPGDPESAMALVSPPPAIMGCPPFDACTLDQIYSLWLEDGWEQYYCRSAEETPQGVWLERVFTLLRIPGGVLPAGAGRAAQTVEPFLLSDREMPRRLYWLMDEPTGQLESSQACWDGHAVPEREACPLATVSWLHALALLNALSRAADLPECYDLSACGEVRAASAALCPSVKVRAPGGDPRRCQGYRLPTEAEWAHAVLAGAMPDAGPPRETEANYCPSGVGCDPTLPGCSLEPNGYGLCDMVGNVWEWIWHESDGEGPMSAPCDLVGARLAMGGGYKSPAPSDAMDAGCWPARGVNDYVASDIGFRIARSLPADPPKE